MLEVAENPQKFQGLYMYEEFHLATAELGEPVLIGLDYFDLSCRFKEER